MNQHTFNKTVWGLLLIGAGVLFLLKQTGVIDLDIGHIVAVYWPAILIYFGLKGIVIQRKLDYGWGGSYIWNLFMILLGGYFLLRNLDINLLEGVNFWQYIVPVLLILFGLNMLAKGPRSPHEERKAALREEHLRKREAHREERAAMKLARMEARYQAKMARRYPSTPGNSEPNPVQDDREEAVPPYDPGYSRKIERDLDQAFQERVVKKMGDDPFPLVSETPFPKGHPPGNGTAPQGKEEAEQTGYGNGAPTPPPPPPQPRSPGQTWKEGWENRRGNWEAHGKRTVERSNFIGDIHLGHDYWELEPTNVSHFIGDTVIDLTKARIPYGETKVTVSAFIGDVKVFVPNDVQVELSVTASAFIGDMKVLDRHEGGLFRHMKYDSKHYADAEKKVNLTVSMFIGDVLIKRVG